MNKKIIGIFVVTLLITTILSIPTIANKPTSDSSKTDPFFDIFVESSVFGLGTRIIINNIGDLTIRDIDWTFNASGGTIVFGDGEHGRIPTMLPNDEIVLLLKPAPGISPDSDGQSPIGLGAITMTVTAQGSVGSTIARGDTSADALLLGPFILMN